MTEQFISSRKNPRLQQTRRILTSRREREETGLFAGEGTKLLAEAVRYAPEWLHTVFLAEGVEQETPEHVRRVRLPRELLDSLSTMDAPQGAIFLCRMPEEPEFVPKPGTLLLDGLQDPGNLGTILRTADALGTSVVLLEGCADRFSPKTVRATMGALFRRPSYRMDWEAARDAFHQAGIPIAVTALSPRAEDIREADVSKMAVVIGSEGRGVRPEVLEQADRELIIPMDPHCESLNAAVAATIVLWQMRK